MLGTGSDVAVRGQSGVAALIEVEEELRRVVRGLDAAVVAPRDAARLVERFTAMGKLVDGAVTLLAARAAEAGEWRRRGALSAAHDLAARAGTSVAQAREVLEASARLAGLEATAEAVRSGRLSAEQAVAVAAAAAVDGRSEGRMLSRAASGSLAGLREERDRVTAAADAADGVERHARLVRTRGLRFGTAADGAGTGSWRLPPEAQAEVKAVLAPFIQAAFDRARREGRREGGDAYAADGLVDLARAAMAAPAPSRRAATASAVSSAAAPAGEAGDQPALDAAAAVAKAVAVGSAPRRRASAKVIVRVDHAALVRGHAAAGEVCEIAGVGPVPVAVVADWIATGDVFLAAVVTRGVDVLTVAHLGRRPNAAQLTALQFRDPVCREERCTRPVREWDHHLDWADTHHTLLGEMGGLCAGHHDLRTRYGWRVAPSPIPGKVRLRAPDDPDPPPD